MKRTVTILGVLTALAVPSVAAAGNVTTQVSKATKAQTAMSKVTRTHARKLNARTGIPELGGLMPSKPAKPSRVQRTYTVRSLGSGFCGSETYVIYVNGKPGLPMC